MIKCRIHVPRLDSSWNVSDYVSLDSTDLSPRYLLDKKDFVEKSAHYT